MINTVFRFKTVHLRSFRAGPSRLSSTLTRAKISKLLNILSKETQAPLWNLIHETRSTTRLPVLRMTDLLQQQGLSVAEFTDWKPVTVDLESALHQLQATNTRIIPPWVAFYLLAYKVRSSAHARGPMMEFVFTHLNTLPLDLQGPLLIFSALHLSNFNLLQPLTRVIDAFLTTQLTHDSSLQFNLLLQALSVNSIRSAESANLVVRILKAMEARQLKLRSDTYHALLNDRFVTVELTRYLRARMVHEGFVPDVKHLEAYLRVFAKGGVVHEAQKYAHAIQQLELGRRSSNSHASTVALSGFKDRASAFEFLKSLAESKRGNSSSRTVPILARTPYLHPLNKKKLDTHDYTASLTVASRDPHVRTGQLLKMFRRMSQIRGGLIRPTIVSYTVVIRGLLYRNVIPVAERIWNEVAKAGYALDRPALTVGVETLTRAGKPHEALELLEKYAYKGAEEVGRCSSPQQLRVDIHTINKFMEALNKVDRPDVVFKLWDYMGNLYGVYPTCESLSILLRAARLACQLDNSFHGTVAHLSLRNPFRKPSQTPTTREEMLQSVVSTLGDRKAGLKPYLSGIWNDDVPVEGAKKVFLKVVFGNAYDRLLEVKPPAYALRTSMDADPLLALRKPPVLDSQCLSTTTGLPADILTPTRTSWYPTIIPTNDNFLQYLLLLGLNQRAAEIPITLAWMRASGVKPDRATLAVALVLWAEVGMQPPLVEAIEEWKRGGGDGGETEEMRGSGQFGRLVEWMKDWVGEGRMPRPENLRKWQFQINRAREGGVC